MTDILVDGQTISVAETYEKVIEKLAEVAVREEPPFVAEFHLPGEEKLRVTIQLLGVSAVME